MATTKPDHVVKRPHGVTVEYRATKDDRGRVTSVERIVKRRDGRVVGKDV